MRYTKILFLFSSIFILFFSSSYTFAAYPFGDELIRYQFEQGTGTVVNSGTGGATYDSAFSGNSAYVATNTTPFGSYAGTFDTAGDYVDTKFGSGRNPTTNPVSVSLWVNKQTACNSDTGDDHIFGYGLTGNNTRFYIRCTNSGSLWAYRLGASAQATAAGAISLNRWYHLALVVEGTNVGFYVNGVHQGTTTVASYSIGGNLYVGSANATATEGGNALLDEVSIYTRSLTATEVAQIYAAGAEVYINATTTNATEGGATGSYAVSLKTAPTANVTVNISSDAQATTSVSSLTFTTANWFTPQTVTVTAEDDATYEGSHTATISHTTSSSDTNYNGLTVDSVVATITDNDIDSSPTITNVSSDKANGTYGAGNVIDIDLTFSEAVTATTSVTVTLETGTTDRTCSFTVSNSTTATCNYTVQAGDVTSDLTVSSVSGYIEDQSGNPMTNFTPSTNLAANKAIVIGEYLSFVSPTVTANSTTTTSSITVYASSTMQTTATSTTGYLSITTPGGGGVSTVSTTTRYGDYNLTHLTNTISGQNLSITANSSGAAYVATSTDPGSIFVVHNSSNVISEISVTGSLIRSITCTSCGDIEGITLVSNVASTTAPGVFDYTFMISTEDNISNLAVFKVVIPSTGTVTVNNSNSFSTGVSTATTNLGLEGIAYDSVRNLFYLAREKTPALFQYVEGGTGSQICSNLNFSSIATDFSDLTYKNNVLYVLSDENSRVIPVDITSTSTCAFVDSDGDGNTSNDTGDYLNNIPFSVGGTTDDQSEGVTWDNTGDYLYVIGEDDDLSRYRTNAFTYRYTFSGLSSGSYILSASSTDATTGLTTYSPLHAFGVNLDSTPPVISNIASSTNSTTATVSWDTDESSDSKVSYGTSAGTYTTSTSSASMVTSHSLGLTGLSADTLYYFVVVSKDASNNIATSSEYTLRTTAAPDTTAPIISSIASSTNATTATITWTTNESATSTVEYGTTSSYGSVSTSGTLTTSHSITLTGLANSTTYHFRVSSGDASYNYATSTDYTFTTTADTGAPNVSSVSAAPSSSSVTITWDTDEDASSLVAYGVSSTYSATTTEADTSPRVSSHSITISDLLSCTKYYFRVASIDASTNVGYGTGSTFTTTGCTGSAGVENVQVDNVTVSSGADLSLTSGSQQIDLDVPPNVTGTSSALTFQIKIITDTNVVQSVSSPTGTAVVDGQVYDLKAYINATTTLTTFDEPITITLSYEDADVEGINEATLKIYLYNGSAWEELSSCTVDTVLNTVSCTTTHFSVFGLFGTSTGGSTSGSRPRNGGGAGAATDASDNDLIAALLARISELKVLLAKMQGGNQVTQTVQISSGFIFTKQLKFGDNNTDVKELQKVLNSDPDTQVAQSGPGSKGNETTIFGYATKAAVIKFQLKHGIIKSTSEAVAGLVGPKTREKLSGR